MTAPDPRTADYLSGLEQRLRDDGCETSTVDLVGGRALVGRRSDFRLRWMATKLHLFTVAVAFPPGLDARVLQLFTDEAMAYARDHKGGLPGGLQTGTAVFPVAVSSDVGSDALAWAAEKQRVQFANAGRPVVVDVAGGQVSTYRGTPALGVIYAAHLRKKSTQYFTLPGT